MDTTIKNNEQGNNSMIPYSFVFSAVFSDGTKIEQFNEDGTENRFQLIRDRSDKLVFFNLKNNAGKMFSINLTNGLIGYNRLEFPYIESKKKENIRLIFFRRHFVKIGIEDLKEKQHEIFYFLGFQYNDKLGNNQKIIFQIDSEGNWILGE